MRLRIIAAVAIVAIIVLVVVVVVRSGPSDPVATDVTATAESEVATDTSARASGSVADTLALLDTLTVAEWPETLPVYDRDDYRQWSDLDGDGCDTRREILADQSVIDTDCESLAGGLWWSPYDARWTDDPGDIQIDHIVALSAAHQAGAWLFTPAEKEAFANDQENLVAVTGSVNQSKGAKTVELWRPDNAGAECWMATRIVSVKSRWSLSITHGERTALLEMLVGCDSDSALLSDITPASRP